MRYDAMFQPISIGGVVLKNRIAVAPMCTSWSTPDGEVTPRQCRYYGRLAQSGAGLVVAESFMVTEDARSGKIRNNIHHDRMIPAARRLAEAIHSGGAKACGIVHHAGGVTNPADIGRFPAAPSAVPVDLKGERMIGLIPRALRTSEVQELVVRFGDGAVRLKKAGFDIIMILAAHGYLINQFLSPFSNRRTDQYGGSEENRMRFLLEIVREIKGRIGDTPLMVRLSCSENFPGGYDFDYILRVSQALERAGVDSINYSNGTMHNFEYNIPSHHGERCLNVRYAAQAAQRLRIPVSVVGRITSPEECCSILENGQAQMVWVGRQFLADPEWLEKARRGTGPIRRCLGCNVGCIGRYSKGLHIGCAVNYEIGHEEYCDRLRQIPPEKKRVLVVGGGAAGMEAARVAAMRGHEVILAEKSSQLGGQLIAAGIPPCKEGISQLRDFLTESLRVLGVRVLLDTPYSEALVRAYRPDVIAAACGAVPRVPQHPGIERKQVVYAEPFLRSGKTGYQDVVILGGGETAVETAEYLLKAGVSRVTVVSRSDDVMRGAEAYSKRQTLESVLSMGCDIRVATAVLEIGEGWVLCQRLEAERFDGPQKIPAELVVVASGYEAVRLRPQTACPVVHLAELDGGSILESIRAGARFGLALGVPEDKIPPEE